MLRITTNSKEFEYSRIPYKSVKASGGKLVVSLSSTRAFCTPSKCAATVLTQSNLADHLVLDVGFRDTGTCFFKIFQRDILELKMLNNF